MKNLLRNCRKAKRWNFLLFFIVIAVLALPSQAESYLSEKQTKITKYAPGVESIINSHQYIQHHPALLYWRISPYYLSQLTDSSCSLATATMIVNAIRSGNRQSVNQPLATQDELIRRVNDAQWATDIKQGGIGVTLDQLKRLMAKSLAAYDIHHFSITVVHLKNNTKNNEALVHHTLKAIENSNKNYIIANFNQKFFTGAESVGHFAPVGAYDAQKHRVLIMDPDRQLYEPYWVPEKLFLNAMATSDHDAKRSRGYLFITIR